MKTEKIKIFKRSTGWMFALSLTVFASLVSCAQDDEKGIDLTVETNRNEVTITVNINGMQIPSTRSVDEATVAELNILVFRGNPAVLDEYALGTNITLESNAGANKVRFQASLSTHSDPATIVLIANANTQTAAAISAAGGMGASKAELLSELTYSSPGNMPIPMYGEAEVNSITSGMKIEGVNLTRMLARIDVVNNAAPDFDLLEVDVVNYHSAGYIAPAWNADTGAMLSALPPSPMIPAASNRQQGIDNAMKYTYSNYNGGNGMFGEIYTYEAATTTSGEEHANRVCLILKGTYRSVEYYYRVDFTSGDSPSTAKYMPLYRNHRYTVSIKTAQGIGYPSAAEALESAGVMNNLKTELLVLDESKITNVAFNGQYYLGIGDNVTWGYLANNKVEVKCATDYPGGWQIAEIEYVSGDQGWLSVTKDGLSDDKIANLLLKPVNEYNQTASDRVANIHLKAGRLTHKLKVTQELNPEFYPDSHSGWAGSNIYFDGTKLTFDDVGNTANRLVQGVLFQWGSLTGISPAGDTSWGGDNRYTSSTTLYPPSGGTSSGIAWTSINRVPDISVVSHPHLNKSPRDRAYLYEITDGAAGVGDICKFLTEQAGGKLHGSKWRMPAFSEFGTVNNYSSSGSFNDVTLVTDNGGMERLTSYITKTDATGDTAFPLSGYRDTGGYLYSVGSDGNYWTSSPDDIYGYYLRFTRLFVYLDRSVERMRGCVVRCVRE